MFPVWVHYLSHRLPTSWGPIPPDTPLLFQRRWHVFSVSGKEPPHLTLSACPCHKLSELMCFTRRLYSAQRNVWIYLAVRPTATRTDRRISCHCRPTFRSGERSTTIHGRDKPQDSNNRSTIELTLWIWLRNSPCGSQLKQHSKSCFNPE